MCETFKEMPLKFVVLRISYFEMNSVLTVNFVG